MKHLKRRFDLSPGDFSAEHDIPPQSDADESPFAFVSHDATREAIEDYLEELADRRGGPRHDRDGETPVQTIRPERRRDGGRRNTDAEVRPPVLDLPGLRRKESGASSPAPLTGAATAGTAR